MNLQRRISALEAVSTQRQFGTLTAIFRDGKRRRMLWPDAMEAALDGRLKAVQSDSILDDPQVNLINIGILQGR